MIKTETKTTEIMKSNYKATFRCSAASSMQVALVKDCVGPLVAVKHLIDLHHDCDIVVEDMEEFKLSSNEPDFIIDLNSCEEEGIDVRDEVIKSITKIDFALVEEEFSDDHQPCIRAVVQTNVGVVQMEDWWIDGKGLAMWYNAELGLTADLFRRLKSCL